MPDISPTYPQDRAQPEPDACSAQAQRPRALEFGMVPHKMSRTEAAAAKWGSGTHRTGWAYAYKSPVWHKVDRFGQTGCGRTFNSRKATWCVDNMLPAEIERCQKCEAGRARQEAAAAEQARIKHETRNQLTLNF